MDPAPTSSLSEVLADRAAKILSGPLHTKYVHNIEIDEAAGFFHCDCSGFVEYLLSKVALRHLLPIRAAASERGARRPLARDFHDFLAAQPDLTAESDGNVEGEDVHGWINIPKLAAARRGDIIVWRLVGSKDTGHVVILADPPVPVDDDAMPGLCFAVRVYDSSEYLHFDDSREVNGDFRSGVGASSIHVDINADGSLAGFRFREGSKYHAESSMTIGRAVGFGTQ